MNSAEVQTGELLGRWKKKKGERLLNLSRKEHPLVRKARCSSLEIPLQAGALNEGQYRKRKQRMHPSYIWT